MKSMEAVSSASPSRFYNIARVNITVPRARGSILMTSLQPNELQTFLTNPARLSLLTAPEEEEKVLKMAAVAALLDLLEKAKQAIEVFGVAMNAVCYMYNADFCNVEELQEAGAGNN